MTTESNTLVQDAVRRAMDGAQSYEEGAKSLLALADADAELAEALWQHYKYQMALEAVRRFHVAVRAKAWQRPSNAPRADVSKLLGTNTQTLMDFPLIGGKRLGDATREELKDSIDYYDRIGRDANTKANWLRGIYNAMPANGRRTVAKTFSVQKLEELQGQAIAKMAA